MRYLQCCEIEGTLAYEGEEKHLYMLDDDDLVSRADRSISSARTADRIFEDFKFAPAAARSSIRWDGEKNFRVVTYEPGDLLDWPEPIPF
jgi:hypothetical protein